MTGYKIPLTLRMTRRIAYIPGR